MNHFFHSPNTLLSSASISCIGIFNVLIIETAVTYSPRLSSRFCTNWTKWTLPCIYQGFRHFYFFLIFPAKECGSAWLCSSISASDPTGSFAVIQLPCAFASCLYELAFVKRLPTGSSLGLPGLGPRSLSSFCPACGRGKHCSYVFCTIRTKWTFVSIYKVRRDLYFSLISRIFTFRTYGA